MLAIKGYSPLQALYSSAREAIAWRMWDYYESIAREAIDDDADDNSNLNPPPPKYPQTDNWHRNIEIGGRFLSYDLIAREIERGGLYALRSDGGLVEIPLRALRPLAIFNADVIGYQGHRSWKIQEGLIKTGEFRFGADTLRLGFWQEYFAKDQVFSEAPLSYSKFQGREILGLPIINWRLGAIDLSFVRALVAASEHFNAARRLLATVQCEAPELPKNTGNSAEAEAVLRMFGPYDGCAVVYPEEWAREFARVLFPVSDVTSNPGPSQPVMDAILAIFDNEGDVPKNEVKRRILAQYARCSGRQFDLYWREIAKSKPAISVPGRKSKRRLAERSKTAGS